mmetsp:Transcript_11098/g.22930  ORF Transcript_11098/g.22930 Transcript_11098/m.22930 type:complete len:204 (-) Transcript_11098:22-633(-)
MAGGAQGVADEAHHDAPDPEGGHLQARRPGHDGPYVLHERGDRQVPRVVRHLPAALLPGRHLRPRPARGLPPQPPALPPGPQLPDVLQPRRIRRPAEGARQGGVGRDPQPPRDGALRPPQQGLPACVHGSVPHAGGVPGDVQPRPLRPHARKVQGRRRLPGGVRQGEAGEGLAGRGNAQETGVKPAQQGSPDPSGRFVLLQYQ